MYRYKFEYSYLHVDEEYISGLAERGWRIISVFPAGDGMVIVLEKEDLGTKSFINRIIGKISSLFR